MDTETSTLLRNSFELNPAEDINSEDELLRILAERIAHMLEHEQEQLMSMLYRLDVEERKILPVLRHGAPEPPNLGLALLVLERQKQRVATKRSIKTLPLEDMEDWVW